MKTTMKTTMKNLTPNSVTTLTNQCIEIADVKNSDVCKKCNADNCTSCSNSRACILPEIDMKQREPETLTSRIEIRFTCPPFDDEFPIDPYVCAEIVVDDMLDKYTKTLNSLFDTPQISFTLLHFDLDNHCFIVDMNYTEKYVSHELHTRLLHRKSSFQCFVHAELANENAYASIYDALLPDLDSDFDTPIDYSLSMILRFLVSAYSN
jgi:hypothetical protein